MLLGLQKQAEFYLVFIFCMWAEYEHYNCTKNEFSKFAQIGSFLPIWSHLVTKSLMENFNFCLNDCNRTRTHNHLVRKRTIWLSVRLQTKWLWVRVSLQSLKLQILHLFWARNSLTFRQLESVDSLWNA